MTNEKNCINGVKIIICPNCGHKFTTKKTIKVQCMNCYIRIKLENYIDKRSKKYHVEREKDKL